MFKIKVDVDDNWIVFTRDNLYGNENLKKYNLTYEYLNNLMQTNFIYLDAIIDDNRELIIRISPAQINNLSNFNTSDLKKFGDALIQKTGATDYNILKNNGITYVRSVYYENYDAKVNILEYVTVINRNYITFTTQSYNGIIEKALEEKIDKIIESAVIQIDSNKTKEYINKGFDWTSVFIKGLLGGIIGMIYGIYRNITNKKKHIN